MTKVLTFAGASLLAISLALPAEAAQAVARSRGGDASPSGSGAGSSSSGGGGADRGSASAPAARRAPSVARPRSTGAQPRGGSGSSVQRGSPQGSGSPAVSQRAGSSRSPRMATSRPPALARPYVPVRPARRSVYLGTSIYTPWYFGGSYGSYYGYNPFGFRYSRFGYYGPFGYVPFGGYYYDPYDSLMFGMYSAPMGGYVASDDRRDERVIGSVRLRMNPRHARVYVDGALVGTVDEFDGLRDHLQLEPGRHELEIRAEGYETYRTDVVVSSGKTRTERATLKRTE